MTRADFSNSKVGTADVDKRAHPEAIESSANSSSNIVASSSSSSSGSSRNSISVALPPECLVQTRPVVLLSNVYDPTDSSCHHSTFFSDLEADMLIECVKYGKVLRLMTPEGPEFDHRGCIAVTYETADAARACAGALHGRRFDGKQIDAMMFATPVLEEAVSESLTAPASSSFEPPPDAATITTQTADAEDVEDFLSSLL